MSYTPEQQAANRKRWVEALRSGEFKQGRSALHTITRDEETFCCLGVACKLAAQDGVVPFSVDVGSPVTSYMRYGSTSGVLPNEVIEWLGANDRWGGRLHGRTLTDLNDHGGLTFDQLADAIESIYE